MIMDENNTSCVEVELLRCRELSIDECEIVGGGDNPGMGPYDAPTGVKSLGPKVSTS